ncbi:MAG: hypothetical protein N4A59_03795 [Marinifilum sp.]|jgi:hypothetical protein|nr:hypothetical protein [Marinifilum sp.]
MELVTYKKFKTEEESVPLVDILESNDISYHIENIASAVDITFTGGTELEDKIAVKLKAVDFERVDTLFQKIVADNLDLVDKDHYLFDFSNEELYEVLENYNEWSKTDFILAQKILTDRGQNVSNEEAQELRNKKIEKLRKAEKGHRGWLIFGFISAIFGGLLGIFIGYHHFKFKKTIPTGERIYAYDAQTRKRGLHIFYVGIVALIFWIIVWLLDLK